MCRELCLKLCQISAKEFGQIIPKNITLRSCTAILKEFGTGSNGKVSFVCHGQEYNRSGFQLWEINRSHYSLDRHDILSTGLAKRFSTTARPFPASRICSRGSRFAK